MALIGGLALCIPLFAASEAWAAGPDCETTQNDADLLQCASHDFENSQKRLDALVRQSLAALPAPARPLFDQAEKAWTSYRDAACIWNAYEIQTGTTSDLIRTTCLADLTAARVEELEAGLGAASPGGPPQPTAPSPNTPLAPIKQ